MICTEDINDLRTKIEEKKGQEIIIKGSLGRSKAFMKEAIIQNAYPSLFYIQYKDNNNCDSYSYTDLLTRIVEVDVYDGNSYSPLIPPPQPKKKKMKKQMQNSQARDFYGQLESIGLDCYTSLNELPSLL